MCCVYCLLDVVCNVLCSTPLTHCLSDTHRDVVCLAVRVAVELSVMRQLASDNANNMHAKNKGGGRKKRRARSRKKAGQNNANARKIVTLMDLLIRSSAHYPQSKRMKDEMKRLVEEDYDERLQVSIIKTYKHVTLNQATKKKREQKCSSAKTNTKRLPIG